MLRRDDQEGLVSDAPKFAMWVRLVPAIPRRLRRPACGLKNSPEEVVAGARTSYMVIIVDDGEVVLWLPQSSLRPSHKLHGETRALRSAWLGLPSNPSNPT